jgi:acyl-CoA thioester hydrolase
MGAMPRHRVLIPLRWSDTDAYGHINNVLFLRLLEEARVQALDDYLAAGSDGPRTALLVARSEIEHLEPLVYRVAPVTVDLWVTRIGAADFDMAYEVLDPTTGSGAAGQNGGAGQNGAGEPDGTVYAQAETMLVVFDQGTARPRRITKPERARLEGWRDEPVRWRRRRPSPR